MTTNDRTHAIAQMREMERVIKPKTGAILARCRAGGGKLGLILSKRRLTTGAYLYSGRLLLTDDYDCEYRITQVRNARLGGRWESRCPSPIGYLPADEVGVLVAGGAVSRGCKGGEWRGKAPSSRS